MLFQSKIWTSGKSCKRLSACLAIRRGIFVVLTSTDLNEIHRILSGLIGQSAWGVFLGVGSYITAEFGSAKSADSGRVHGEWHLWVYNCAWRLQTADAVLAGSEDDRERLRTVLEALNGKTLRSFTVYCPAGEATLTFEGDLELRLFPVTTTDYEHWMVFAPDGHVLQMGPGAEWTYTTGSALPA